MIRFANPRVPCPFCGAVVPNERCPGEPYECASCRAKLQMRKKGSGKLLYSAVAISVAVGWVGGARGLGLVTAAAIIFFVAFGVLVWLQLRFFPPPFEPYDGHKIIG